MTKKSDKPKIEKTGVLVRIDNDILQQIDVIAEEAETSRAAVVTGLIESALDKPFFLNYLGLTPRRLPKVAWSLYNKNAAYLFEEGFDETIPGLGQIEDYVRLKADFEEIARREREGEDW